MPIVLFWIGLVVVLSVAVPPLEQVSQEHTVSLAPDDAPSMQAMKRVGKDFQEFDSNSSAMILLEGDQPLGAEAHRYYDGLIQKLRDDPKHVEHIQDFWGDPLTAAGSQSADGKAAYVQVYLAGNQGESLANESVDAVQKIVTANPPPAGIKVYVTGPTALSHDQHNVGDSAVKVVEMVTIGVIFVMLLLVYRSIVTTILVLVMVFLELTAARGSSRSWATPRSSVCRRSRSTCWRPCRSPRPPTTRYSCSGAITRPAWTAKIAKPRSTPCTTAQPT